MEKDVDDSDIGKLTSWEEVVDNEETRRTVEAEDVPDVNECQTLADEAVANTEEVLSDQVINPDLYRAHQTVYLKPQRGSKVSNVSTDANNNPKFTLLSLVENGF